jgi:hypothetical protein
MTQTEIAQAMTKAKEEAQNLENTLRDSNKTAQYLVDVISFKQPAKDVTKRIVKHFEATYNEKVKESTMKYNAGEISSIEHERNLRQEKFLLDTKTSVIKGFIEATFNTLWNLTVKKMKEDGVDPSKYLSAHFYQEIVNQWYEDNIYSNDLFQAYMGLTQAVENVGVLKESQQVEADVLRVAQNDFKIAYKMLTGKDIEFDNSPEGQATQDKIDGYFGSMNKAYTDKQMLLQIAQQLSAGNMTAALLNFNAFLSHNNLQADYSCTDSYWATYASLLLYELFKDQIDEFAHDIGAGAQSLSNMMMFIPNAIVYPLKIIKMFDFEIDTQKDWEKERLKVLLREITEKIAEWNERPCAVYEMVAYFAEILLLMKTNNMLNFNIKDENEQIRLMNMFGSEDALNVLENSLEITLESYLEVKLDNVQNLNFIYLLMIVTYAPYITQAITGQSLDALLGV